MFIEEKIDRILAMLEGLTVGQQIIDAQLHAAEPSKRGRKAKGEVNGVAVAPAAAPAATPAATEVSASAASISPSDDPFADAAPAAPVATQAQMRAAILALRDATDQATALAVMKKYGAENFGAVKEADYGSIVRDATAALPAVKVVVDDPFADTATAPASSTPSATLAPATATLDEVKKAIVQAQKRTSTDKVQQVVMDNGGVGVGASGAKGPSLKSLPADKYALVIDLIAKLPSTK
jgi:hypothetical protein